MTFADFKFVPTPKWEMLLARLFGEKIVGMDFDGASNARVASYRWRGKLYIVREN